MNNSPLYSGERQSYLDSALMIRPKNPGYWQQKSMPLLKMKKYELGMMYLDSAVKYDHGVHYLEYRAFIKCIYGRNYSGAIQDFEKAKMTIGYSYVMDHSYDFYMGLCYLQSNKFEIADSLISNSIHITETKFKEGHYLEYFYLGIVKMEKKQDSLAIACFDKALKIYANFPDAKFYKGLCLMNQNRIKESSAVFSDGLKDYLQGYTNNEDNSLYEDYPYSVNRYHYEEMERYVKSLLN